jgi:HNH endonuclease
MPTQDSLHAAPGASERGASDDSSGLCDKLEAALANVQQLVREARPRSTSGNQAMAIVAAFTEIERAAASGVALFTPRVVEAGSFAKAGHGSAHDWLGSLSGMSAAKAKGRLAAAERAAADSKLTEALHGSELSTDQLGVVTSLAAEVPEATGSLLDLIDQGGSQQELTDTASRLRAAKRSRETECVRRDRVHSQRHFRWRQDESGGIRGEFYCDEIAWARVAPRLEAEATRRWKVAGGSGGEAGAGASRDSLAAHRVDGFITLLAGSGPAGAGSATKVETLVIVDAAGLRRGTTEGDEICEVEGIGPVSVLAATELLTEGGLRYLVKEGFDIKTVTKRTRDIARCIDLALIVRDRTCARPGCGNRLGLERDHRKVDYQDHGPTELDNLVRLCPECHALKTFGGWRLEGTPGKWKWIAPKSPKSAQYIARARKLAAARAKSNRIRPQPSDP